MSNVRATSYNHTSHSKFSAPPTSLGRHYLTFPDGDIVLKSSDGVKFRVDSAILRRASPFFFTMLQLPSPHEDLHSLPVPIEMSETADVLDDILRSIYPASAPLKIVEHGHAIELLRAVDKLQISKTSINNVLEIYVGALSPPLRAYAMAVEFGLSAARRAAVRRFIQRNGVDHLDDDILELKYVEGRSLLNLWRIRRDTFARAQRAAEELFRAWTCASHQRPSGIWSETRTKALAQPFDADVQAENVIGAIAVNCGNCANQYRSEEFSQRRSMVRAYIESLLECAERIDSDFPVAVQWIEFPLFPM